LPFNVHIYYTQSVPLLYSAKRRTKTMDRYAGLLRLGVFVVLGICAVEIAISARATPRIPLRPTPVPVPRLTYSPQQTAIEQFKQEYQLDIDGWADLRPILEQTGAIN
jgi:hypothetical protein